MIGAMNTLQLTINGNMLTVPSTIITIDALLEHLKIKNESAIVERNAEILDKSTYNTAPLTNGDRLEIVHFVGGG